MEKAMKTSEEAGIIERALEERGYSAFFGEGLKEQIASFVNDPKKPNVMELDKLMEGDRLLFSLLIRSFDQANPVPAFLVSRGLPDGKKAELFIHSVMSFAKAANLVHGRAVQLNSNRIGEFDPIWVRARFNVDGSGSGEVVRVNAYQMEGKRELKNLFKLLELENEPNIFTKELWVMKLAGGDMPLLNTRFGKFYISAEPEINSLSLWDKDKNLLIPDIKDEKERKKTFNTDIQSEEELKQPKVKRTAKL